MQLENITSVWSVIFLQYNFRSLFTTPPTSTEKLFDSIKSCISIFEPEVLDQLKPAPEKSVHQLEDVFEHAFGQQLPPSYKMYLQQMGGEDGGLLTDFIDSTFVKSDKSFWKIDDMALWTQTFWENFKIQDEIRAKTPELPPFWYFSYCRIDETGWAFSPEMEPLDQLIWTQSTEVYRTNDTFSKWLFFQVYKRLLNWMDRSGERSENVFSCFEKKLDGIVSLFLSLDCPQEWILPRHELLITFLNQLESRFSFEETWFSTGKDLFLFNWENKPTSTAEYDVARYVAVHSTLDLTICVQCISSFDRTHTTLEVRIMGRDAQYMRDILDMILQNTKLEYSRISCFHQHPQNPA